MTVISLASSNPMPVTFSIISTEGFRLKRKKSCHIKERCSNLFNKPCCEYKRFCNVPLGSSKFSSSLILYLRSSTTLVKNKSLTLVGLFVDLNFLRLRKSPLKFPSLCYHQSRGWGYHKFPWNFLKASTREPLMTVMNCTKQNALCSTPHHIVSELSISHTHSFLLSVITWDGYNNWLICQLFVQCTYNQKQLVCDLNLGHKSTCIRM